MEIRDLDFALIPLATGRLGDDPYAKSARALVGGRRSTGVYKPSLYGGNFSLKSLKIYLFTA
jgi:hypothetical protein